MFRCAVPRTPQAFSRCRTSTLVSTPTFSRRFASKIPSDLKFTASHEWIKVNGNTGTVGITDYAQSALGDVVFVDLPAVGKKLSAGGSFGAVESVKAASDLYAPVAGEVVEVNTALSKDTALVNQSPYDRAWMIKIKMSNAGDVSKLLDAKAYEAKLKAEGH